MEDFFLGRLPNISPDRDLRLMVTHNTDSERGMGGAPVYARNHNVLIGLLNSSEKPSKKLRDDIKELMEMFVEAKEKEIAAKKQELRL